MAAAQRRPQSFPEIDRGAWFARLEDPHRPNETAA